jgi:hypothetical protein
VTIATLSRFAAGRAALPAAAARAADATAAAGATNACGAGVIYDRSAAGTADRNSEGESQNRATHTVLRSA